MTDTGRPGSYKVRDFDALRRSPRRTYVDMMIGRGGLAAFVKYELVVGLLGIVPGALGLVLRKRFYPSILGSVGKNVVFGRNVVIRHGGKIHIGSDVIVDDNCVIDAKGGSGSGIRLGDGVFVGRNTILYTKGGVIDVGDRVNIGANCVVYAKNQVVVGPGAMIAAYCHIMSGGQYDYRSEVPLHRQDSLSRGPTLIGTDCWLGSKAVVQDNVSVGRRAVVGAGAVVTRNVPEGAVATGVPARVRPGPSRAGPVRGAEGTDLPLDA